MSNYYDKRDAKVRIAHELMERGWDVQGYSPDQSDSMTDYYCPAHWDGIATKNGYILVVDNRYSAESKPIERYNPKGNLSFEDRERITKLEAMTQANGATAGEEENAKALINKIKEKVSDQPSYEIVGYTLAHMGNPKGSIWHIEKDGKIYDKGNALTKFSDVPNSYRFDLNTMQYKTGYKHWGEISDDQRKVINEFKALILRFERVVNGMNSMGDGTAETEKEGLENQKAGYEKVIKNIAKKVIKPVEKADQTINVNDVLSFSYHGHYWIVTQIYENSKGVQCAVYELLGSEKRGYQRLNGTSCKRYYQSMPRLEKEITEGKVKVYILQEVEEITPTEKWVKTGTTKKTYNTTKKVEQKTETKTEPAQKKEQSKQTEQAEIKTEQPTTQEKPTMNINSESGNIELTFSNSPNLDTKNNLRLNGFRLNSITKVWEIKNTPKNLEKVSALFGITAEQAQTEADRSKTEETADNNTKEEKARTIYHADININRKLNGIEIKFIDEPDSNTITELNKYGFRYSKFKDIWYSVYTESRLQKACTITGNTYEQYKEAI